MSRRITQNLWTHLESLTNLLIEIEVMGPGLRCLSEHFLAFIESIARTRDRLKKIRKFSRSRSESRRRGCEVREPAGPRAGACGVIRHRPPRTPPVSSTGRAASVLAPALARSGDLIYARQDARGSRPVGEIFREGLGRDDLLVAHSAQLKSELHGDNQRRPD